MYGNKSLLCELLHTKSGIRAVALSAMVSSEILVGSNVALTAARCGTRRVGEREYVQVASGPARSIFSDASFLSTKA